MGKPRGSSNVRSYKLAADALERGAKQGKLSPIEVMLENMWDSFDRALRVKGTHKKANDERSHLRSKAQAYAADAAPYCHPKMQNVDVNTFYPKEEKENRMVIEFVNAPKKRE